MRSRTVFLIGALCGIVVSAIFQSVPLIAQTPAVTRPSSSSDGRGAKLSPTYVNSYRLQTLVDGIVIDVGFNSSKPEASPDAGKSQFSVTDRIIMSYYTMKRLQNSLGLVVKRYEEKFGPIQQPPGVPTNPATH